MKIPTLFLQIAEGLAFLLLSPLLVWARIPLPEYASFTAPSQWLSLIPGYSGVLLRRVWYRHTLKKCGVNLMVDWLAAIRTRATEIGDRCTIGVSSWISWVKIGNDVIMGSHVVITSGRRQHDFSDLSKPIRLQAGMKYQVIINDDVWIGAHATIMSDISKGTVVGAGSVVTREYYPESIIAGNPARVLRNRKSPGPP